MKVELEKIVEGEEKITIQYKEMTEELSNIIKVLEKRKPNIVGKVLNKRYLLDYETIYYFEYVDHAVFAYTKNNVYKVKYTLSELENLLATYAFFRCSKSVIININRIKSLRSFVGSRIDICLNNEEHIIMSRRYAKEFREVLKGREF